MEAYGDLLLHGYLIGAAAVFVLGLLWPIALAVFDPEFTGDLEEVAMLFGLTLICTVIWPLVMPLLAWYVLLKGISWLCQSIRARRENRDAI